MTDFTDEAVKALPHEIQVWRSTDTLDHIGTWATTRFPPEAVTYVSKADAQAAVALVVEEACLAVSEQADWPEDEHGRTEQPALFARVVSAIRALAPADGLAAVEALRVEARENAMQALASMGQAHEAYEAQLEAEAELAAAQQREAELLAALEDPLVVHLNMVAGKIAKPLPSQLAHIYGEDVIRAALAPTPPADTWHERRTMLPDGDARKGEG